MKQTLLTLCMILFALPSWGMNIEEIKKDFLKKQKNRLVQEQIRIANDEVQFRIIALEFGIIIDDNSSHSERK